MEANKLNRGFWIRHTLKPYKNRKHSDYRRNNYNITEHQRQEHISKTYNHQSKKCSRKSSKQKSKVDEQMLAERLLFFKLHECLDKFFNRCAKPRQIIRSNLKNYMSDQYMVSICHKTRNENTFIKLLFCDTHKYSVGKCIYIIEYSKKLFKICGPEPQQTINLDTDEPKSQKSINLDTDEFNLLFYSDEMIKNIFSIIKIQIPTKPIISVVQRLREMKAVVSKYFANDVIKLIKDYYDYSDMKIC